MHCIVSLVRPGPKFCPGELVLILSVQWFVLICKDPFRNSGSLCPSWDRSDHKHFTNGELHPSVSALILRFLLMSVGQVGPLFWPFMFLDMLTCSMLHSDTCLPKQIKAISDYLNTSVLSASLCGILTGWKKNMLDT